VSAPHKILLDTDIGYGTDADDALALAFLLAEARCELLAVTTVGLHAEWRAEMAEAVCAAMGRGDVPVVAGADTPLYANPFWGENPIRRWPPAERGGAPCAHRPGRAVAAMRRILRDAPGEVTVVAIGQATNLARLALEDPEALAMARGVVAMGGRFDREATECNVVLDPVAAGIAYRHLGERLTLVPLDAVRAMPFTAEELEGVLAGEALAAVRDCCGSWLERRGADRGIGAADPATCAVALDDALAEIATGRIGVTLGHRPLAGGDPYPDGGVIGTTTFDQTGGHRLVRRVDAAALHATVARTFERWRDAAVAGR